MELQARVRLAGADGSRDRILAGELNASIIDSTASVLTVALTETLPDECVMMLEVATQDDWHQPRNGLFLMQSSKSDGLDVTGTRTFTGTNWFASLARHAFARPVPSGPVREPAGERVFRNPGDAVHTLISEEKADGWAPAVQTEFDGFHDSYGAPWVDAEDGPVTVRVWQSLADTLKGIADQGLARWWTEGTALMMLRPGVGEDRTGTVKLRSGTSLPIDTDASDICTDLHVTYGDKGKHVNVPNPGADSSLGKRWGVLTLSDAKTEAQAVQLAQSYLDDLRAPLVQVGFEYEGSIDFVPFADFEVGDTVLARVGDGWEPRTVVGVSVDVNTVSRVRVTVGDRIVSKNAKRAERVGKLTLGTITGGPVAVPSTNPRTSTIPAAPVGLRVTSNVGRWVDGFPVGAVTLEWDEVTSASDGTSLEVAGYEVWAASSSKPWHRLTGTVGTTAVLEWPFGEARDLRVIAQSASGEWGPPSAVVAVDPVAPVQDDTILDAPILETASGVVLVYAPESGVPAGFQFVTTQWRLDGDTDWVTLAGQGDLSGQLAVIKAPAGQIIDVRLLWRDTAGRTSDPSPVAQIVVGAIGDDIGPGAITYDKLAAEEIWASEAWLDILRAGVIEVEMLHPGVGGLLDISANEAVQVTVGRLDGLDETVGQFAQVVLFEPDGTAWTSPGSPVSLKVSNEGVSIRREGRVLTQWTETEMQVQALRAEQTFIGDTLLSARPGGGFTWTHI